jgi:formylglycine-generating enzyme
VVAVAVKDMVLVPGGAFLMGSDAFYPEERPVRGVEAADLWVDEHPVTNAQFRRFARETEHVTIAERDPDPVDFPGADPADLAAGSQVFVGTPGPVPLDNWMRWWAWVPGADWRHPEGPGSSLHGRELHPVVHIGFEDAAAYADWAGKLLPTDWEWEHAARGGLEQATYPWGDEFTPNGKPMANTWQGRFPYENVSPPGLARTCPVKRFPANGFGLFDVGRERVGMDPHPLDEHPRRPGGGAPFVLRTRLGDRAGPPGDERRVAPVRTGVLPPVPAGRPAGAGGPEHDQSPRLPLLPARVSGEPRFGCVASVASVHPVVAACSGRAGRVIPLG